MASLDEAVPPLGRKSSGDLDLALGKETYGDEFLTGSAELTVNDIHNLTAKWSPAGDRPGALQKSPFQSGVAPTASGASSVGASSTAESFPVTPLDDTGASHAAPARISPVPSSRSSSMASSPSRPPARAPSASSTPRPTKLPRVALLAQQQGASKNRQEDEGAARAKSAPRPSPRASSATTASRATSARSGTVAGTSTSRASPARAPNVASSARTTPIRKEASGPASPTAVASRAASVSSIPSPSKSPSSLQTRASAREPVPAALRRDRSAPLTTRTGATASRIGSGLGARQVGARQRSEVRQAAAAAEELEKATPETRRQLETLRDELQDIKRELEIEAAAKAKQEEEEKKRKAEEEEAERKRQEDEERKRKEDEEEAERKRKEEEEAEAERKRIEEAERKKKEEEEAEAARKKAEEEARLKAEEEARELAELEARERAENTQQWRSLNDYDPTKNRYSAEPEAVPARKCCGCSVM